MKKGINFQLIDFKEEMVKIINLPEENYPNLKISQVNKNLKDKK